jgi:hypothetical protein
VRKLFTEVGANPSLKTVFQLAAALGLRLAIIELPPPPLEPLPEDGQPPKKR